VLACAAEGARHPARGTQVSTRLQLSAFFQKETTHMAKVRPLHDRLLVKRIEEKETVKGGIIIPDTAKEKPQEGEVIAVGNGKILDNGSKLALDVKAGDKILFGKYSGTDIKIDGEEYLILREDEVLAVIG
jgi:chaperonin GroES